MVGFAVFVRSAPMMAFGPFACVVADRIHRGRMLLFTQSLGVVTGLACSSPCRARWCSSPRPRSEQPLGTLWLGVLASGISVAPAIALNSTLAFLTIAPVALTLARLGPRRETATT